MELHMRLLSAASKSGIIARRGRLLPHIAVAVMRCIREGSIDPNDEAAGEFEAFINVADRVL